MYIPSRHKGCSTSQQVLFVPNFEAAISRERPFTQVVDTCGFAIGGAETQLTDSDPPRTAGLSSKTKGLTPAQMVWLTWEQELMGQLICKCAVNVDFQSTPAKLSTTSDRS